MTRKKDEAARIDAEEVTLLEELFPSSDNNQLVDIDESHLVAFGQLISYAAVLGGMVTLYGRDGDDSIGISVRFGKRKRSVSYSNDDLSYTVLVHFVNGLKQLYLHRLSGVAAPRDAHKPLKAGKAKG